LSIPNRIWNIGKAHLNQIRDRIDDALAEKELDLSASDPGLPDREDSSPDAMMQRAQARIDAARRELEARQRLGNGEAGNAPPSPVPSPSSRQETKTDLASDPNAADYKVFGLPVGSDLAAVVVKYEELINRCDPRRFPEGSEEQITAKAILAKVNTSYDALRKRLDPTANRFGKLELE
jgi:hypothetical protein